MLNEKLTIIVPTFGRPKFVERVVQYSNLFGLKVVIADGSPKSLDIETIRAIEKSKHIKYFHDKSDMPARIKNAAKIVQTDFCMCMADDDLFLPSGLSAAIEKLVLDKSAVACMGQALGFDVIYGKRYFFNYGNSLKNYQLRNDNPAERLKLGIKKYRSVAFYAVFRTQDFRLIWRNIEGSCCPEQIEYEHAICTFYQGNVITSDKVYWLRSFEAEPVSSDEAGKRNINFAYWYTNNDFWREVNAFNIRTSNFIARDATNLTEANKLIEATCLFIVEGRHIGLMNKEKKWLRLLLMNKKVLDFWTGSVLRNSWFGRAVRSAVRYHSREKIKINAFDKGFASSDMHKLIKLINS